MHDSAGESLETSFREALVLLCTVSRAETSCRMSAGEEVADRRSCSDGESAARKEVFAASKALVR